MQHLDVYGGPDNTRRTFDANVSQHDLVGTFLPAFEACSDAGTRRSLQDHFLMSSRCTGLYVLIQRNSGSPCLCQLSYHDNVCT